jgi:hypothetical protein
MEPLNDGDLKALLRRWEAPPAPATLRSPVRLRRQPWWLWWLTGTIRIPAPVGIALALLIALWVYWGRSASPTLERPVENVTSPVRVEPASPTPVAPITTPAPTAPPDAKQPVIAASAAPLSLGGFRPVDQVELRILRTTR